MSLDVRSAKLLDLVDSEAQVEQIGTGCVFTEGPIWNAEGDSVNYIRPFPAFNSDVTEGIGFMWTYEREHRSLFRKNTKLWGC